MNTILIYGHDKVLYIISNLAASLADIYSDSFVIVMYTE